MTDIAAFFTTQPLFALFFTIEIGRASCRERVF